MQKSVQTNRTYYSFCDGINVDRSTQAPPITREITHIILKFVYDKVVVKSLIELVRVNILKGYTSIQRNE